MLRTVDLEIIGRSAAHQQDSRYHQEIANRKACIFFRFGFRLGNRLRVRLRLCDRLLDLGFRVCFGKGQQVFFRDSVQEIHIFLGALSVNDQIKDILAGGGDGEKLLAVLVGGIVHHRSRPVRSEGLGNGFRCGGQRGFLCGLVTLGVGRDAHTGKRKQGGGQNRGPAKQLIPHGRYPPLFPRTSGQLGPRW